MNILMDTSAILAGTVPPPDAQLYCPPGVIEELQSRAAKNQFEHLQIRGLQCSSPSLEALHRVRTCTGELNEDGRLSETDIEVLALALDLNAEIWSDDYSIQNTAMVLGLRFRPLEEAGITSVFKYQYRCRGCGRYSRSAVPNNECPICGSEYRPVRSRTRPRHPSRP